MINIILAISEAATAIPVKPRMPAIMEITRNVNTQVNIASVVPDIYSTNDITNMIKKIRKIILNLQLQQRRQ